MSPAQSNNDSMILDLNCYREQINLEFNDLTYKTEEKKKPPIIKGVSGTFYAGRLAGIIGPSGAGKSTLLNVLSGFKSTGVTGQIKTNGVVPDMHDFRQKRSYIPQDFALLEKLSLLETLDFAAELKLSNKISKVKKRGIVNNIIQLLNMKKCENTLVGQLSGGEKKRVSIGTELITNPPVMFFDEPTSGLDSSSSIQVISHLKELALEGRTIICVIHQPSSKLLEFFDDLLVLSDGICIYNGPINEMVDVFSQSGFCCPNFYNRADFALEVASNERSGDLEQLIRKGDRKPPIGFQSPTEALNNRKHDTVINEKSSMLRSEDYGDKLNGKSLVQNGHLVNINNYKIVGYPTPFWMQFLILLKRNSLCMIRDIHFVQLRFICHILIGALLGGVFYDIGNEASKIQSNVSCLFFFLLFIFFANSMPTVLSFPSETAVFLREHLNNYYSLGIYYLAKLVADLPLQIIGPSSFILVAYYMTGQPPEGERLLKIWLICVFTTGIAQAVGLIAGAAFNVQLGIFLVPCHAIPMLVFSGFFIKFNELFPSLKPFTYISYFRYGFEGSVQAIYGSNRTQLACPGTFCFYKNPKKFLNHMSMEEDRFWLDLGALGVWIVTLQIILYFALMIRLRKAQ